MAAVAPDPDTQPQRPSVVKQKSVKNTFSLVTMARHSIGVTEPKGSSDAMSKQWNSLSVVAALLTGVAASGMFIAADYVRNFSSKEKEEMQAANQTSTPTSTTTAGFATAGFAKLTMMAFCIDTFCFLNATVLSTFFVSFQKRNIELDLDQIVKALGYWTFQAPRIYFRVGYYLMIVELSMFFMMVMSLTETIGCLVFCITLVMGPMVYMLAISLQKFDLIELSEKRQREEGEHRAAPKMGLILEDAVEA